MAQEKMDSWWEYARELAKAERELKIEKWVYISIEYKEENGERIVLYHYDLPRELHERYRWVIRWREAKLLCQYPKKNIHTYYSYYDKRTGLNTDFNSLLSKLTSTKAQITIAERKEQEFLQYQRQNNLFFDEQTDEQLIKFRKKLSKKRQQYKELITKIVTNERKTSSLLECFLQRAQYIFGFYPNIAKEAKCHKASNSW